MRIATFNIDSVNRRLDILSGWLADEAPDVVCLQELKAEDAAFPAKALEAAGYGAVWRGQRAWNGVAILARGATPVLTRRALPGDLEDRQARYIEAAVGGVLVASIYAPNGNPVGSSKYAYKLAWLERLIAHARDLAAAGVPVALAGDFNVVPMETDIWLGHHEQDNALLQPEPRSAFMRLMDEGYVDTLRMVSPRGPLWTFWGRLRMRWPRDQGMRLDHILVSHALKPRVRAAGVSREVRGLAGASDHAPAWIELEGTGRVGAAGRRGPRGAARRRPGGPAP